MCILLLLLFSFTAVADWSNSWEFNYQEEGYDPQGPFEAYATFSFSGRANITEVPAPPVFSSYATLSFSGRANITEVSSNPSVAPSTWNGGSPDCGDSITENFTYYQNGTATLNVTIGFNDTNYTYVNWATYDASGHDQYTANFTIDNWATETNIAAGYPPTTVLNNSVGGNSNFTFGIRIWIPKSVTTDVLEDFEIVIDEVIV